MLLSELRTIIGEELVFHEITDGGRISCTFPSVETSHCEHGSLSTTLGIGNTQEEAMEDYANDLNGRWLVYKPANDSIKEFRLPNDMRAKEQAKEQAEERAKADVVFELIGIVTFTVLIVAFVVGGAYGASHVWDNTTIKKIDTGYQITLFSNPEPIRDYPSWPDEHVTFVMTNDGIMYTFETPHELAVSDVQTLKLLVAGYPTLGILAGLRFNRIQNDDCVISVDDPSDMSAWAERVKRREESKP